MRILDLNNFYTPTGGGVRVYHQRKLDFFAERPGDRYTLVVPGERLQSRTHGAATVLEVPARALGASGYRAITSPAVIRQVIASCRPDLIEIGSPYLMPWLVRVALAGSDLRPATVGFVHADVPDTYVRPALTSGPLGRLTRPLAAPLTAAASRVFARTYAWMTATCGASEHVLRGLRRLGLRRLFHTPLGVETAIFTPERRSLARRRSLGIADDAHLVLFVGRLSSEKGIELLCDAWPRLAGERRLRLMIAGHGPREAAVAALIAGDPSILRVDLGSREEVATWMASADHFLSLGAHETFSLTTLEAIAAGTPVIAADRGGAAELVARLAAGSTFTADDPEALVAAIRGVVTTRQPLPPTLRATIEAEYTWPAACTRLRRIYAALPEVAAAAAADPAALRRLEAPEGWWPAVTERLPMGPRPAGGNPQNIV